MSYDLGNRDFIMNIDRSKEYEIILHTIGYDMLKDLMEVFKEKDISKYFKFTTVYSLYNSKIEERKTTLSLNAFTEFLSKLEMDSFNKNDI